MSNQKRIDGFDFWLFLWKTYFLPGLVDFFDNDGCFFAVRKCFSMN